MVFMSALMANASNNGVSVVMYSGNDDSLVPRWGDQVVIQNMTWGGVQGFSQVPSTAWTNDNGDFAGIVHQERNLTYAIVYGAGHQVPYYQPAAAKVFLREFILGSNPTGTVTSRSKAPVGGENSTLTGDALLGGNGIFFGAAETQGTVQAPSATVEAWQQFIQTATASPS